MGYGAMQLAGPGVWGPPRDPDAAVAVLRQAVAAGVNHIDTSDFYGPHVTNQIIRRALHPYPKELVIITKVGARRGADKSWIPALSRQELIDAVHDNLRNLDIQNLDVVNLRVGGIEKPSEGSIAEPLNVLVQLKHQGVIRHIGLSNVTPRQLADAQTLTEIVCVQNLYNIRRNTDAAGTGVVAPAFAEHSADSWNVVGAASARESGSCRLEFAIGRARQDGLNRCENRTKS
jgi:aryl-alcohol dehydrogenase-like predicted oxidoreductase